MGRRLVVDREADSRDQRYVAVLSAVRMQYSLEGA